MYFLKLEFQNFSRKLFSGNVAFVSWSARRVLSNDKRIQYVTIALKGKFTLQCNVLFVTLKI